MSADLHPSRRGDAVEAPLLERLVAALRCLPGVGPKSAQRMAFHLLERDREGGRRLAEVMSEAMERVGRCRMCRTLTEEATCALCLDERRDRSLLCVVETPADLESIEQANAYTGMYFVLMGRLSPMDGIGPDELGVERLLQVVRDHPVREVILATNLTVEGEATADYLATLLHDAGVSVSRLARGIPVGGELEYLDQGTVAQALRGRAAVESAGE